MNHNNATTEHSVGDGAVTPRLLDSITDLARKVGFRDLDWGAAKAAAHRMLPAEMIITLRQAIATLGEAWARACYEATQREIHAPQDIWVDDLTEVGEMITVGFTVAELHARLGDAMAADPDVGAMRVVGAGGREVVNLEIGRTRESPTEDSDYVLVLRDR